MITIKELNIVYKVINILFIKFSSFIFLYPMAILVSRSLGAQGYGIYGVVTAGAALLMVLATIGSDQMLVKNIACRYEKDKNSISKPISVTVALSLITTSLIILTLLITYFITTDIVWLYILMLIPLMMVRKIFISIARGMDRSVQAKFSEDIIQPAVCLLIISMNYFYWKVELWVIISALAFSYVVSCIYSTYLLRDQWHLLFSKFNFDEAKYWTILAVPFLGMAISNSIMTYADRVMLALLHSYSEAGLYLVAARNASLVMVCFGCMQFIMNPKVASIDSQDKDKIQSIALLHVTLLVVFGTVTTLILLFFSDFILSLFGKEFSDAKMAMIILIMFYYVMFFGGAPVQYLFMTGHEKVGIKIILASLVLNLLLNTLLIPIYGAVGAAVATGLSLLFKTILGSIIFYRKIGVNTDIFSILWARFFRRWDDL